MYGVDVGVGPDRGCGGCGVLGVSVVGVVVVVVVVVEVIRGGVVVEEMRSSSRWVVCQESLLSSSLS